MNRLMIAQRLENGFIHEKIKLKICVCFYRGGINKYSEII